jgi:hypothetical protein
LIDSFYDFNIRTSVNNTAAIHMSKVQLTSAFSLP